MTDIESPTNRQFIFHRDNRQPTELLRIVPRDSGFDVVIPEHVTLTEAAQTFIDAVNDLLAKSKEARERML